MSKLQITRLLKRYGDHAAVRDVSVSVTEGHMAVLLGPSGCGKTTTLRVVAGLLNPDGGTVAIDGKEIAGPGWGLPPERRNLAMVFQSYALWPHKTVFENVAYGLQVRRFSRDEIRRQVEAALAKVRMQGLSRRYPAELSGGQQQRVALARAIVVQPDLLLLDEPLSNLDAVLRDQMRGELKTLQRELGITSVYVTHDQAEAMVLADHLVVMHDGVIEQQGGAEEIYLRPRSRFVAGFLGVTNLVEGRVARLEGDLGCLEVPGQRPLWAYLHPGAQSDLSPGDKACISIRPVEVVLSALPPEVEGCNRVEGRVLHRAFLGELVEYTIAGGGTTWKVRTHPSEQYAQAQPVWVSFAYEAATMVIDS